MENEKKANKKKTAAPLNAEDPEAQNIRYRQLVENSPNVIFCVSPAGKIVFINSAFKKAFGLDENILGKSYERLFSGEDQADIDDILEKAFSGKTYRNLEFEFKGGSTKKFYSNTHIYPIPEADKKINECVFIITDITKSKLEHAERVESEKKYRALFDLSPSPIVIIDLQTRKIIDWNLAALRLLNYSSKEIKNIKMAGLHEKKIYDKTRVEMEMQLIKKGRFSVETVWVDKEGSEIPVNLYGGYLELKKKNLVQIYAYDITDKKKSEKEILENLEIRTALFEGSRDPMILVDLENKCRFANPAITRVFGYTQDELIGKTFPGADAIDEDMFDDWVKLCKKGTGISNYETMRISKSGHKIPVSITISPIKNSRGELVYLSFWYRDVSENKKAEDELRNAHEAIKKYAEELKELNANKDKFFSIIAHDLRSPFQGLLGFCNLLNTEYDNLNEEESKFIIHNIGESAKNIFALIENLLEWSRIQSGRKDFVPKKLNLYEEVLTAIISQKIQAINKEITLKNTVEENIFVRGDENMLQTVLRNLISNGIKFTPHDGGIVVSAAVKKDMVEICIEDTGVGILEDDIPRMFRIESHFVTQGTNKEPGTGLGLILCKEFVQKHKGEIWVESTPTVGSRFYFTIPKA